MVVNFQMMGRCIHQKGKSEHLYYSPISRQAYNIIYVPKTSIILVICEIQLENRTVDSPAGWFFPVHPVGCGIFHVVVVYTIPARFSEPSPGWQI